MFCNMDYGWNLQERRRNLQLAWDKHNFFLSEPTGTCSEPAQFGAPRAGQTPFLEKCQSLGTCWNIIGTY